MIPRLPDWVRHVGTHLVTLYPPGGGGRIRYYERIRPVRRMSEIVAYVVARDPGFRALGLHDATSLVTAEGEHGAWVRVSGTRDDAPAVRFVGAVFTDEFAAALDAVATPDGAPALEAAARELLLGVTLGLGVRRRRFRYQAPAGWQPLVRGLEAAWYPADFPNNRTSLVVPAAEPASLDLVAALDGFVAGERAAGHEVDGRIDEEPIVSDDGLDGRRWSVRVRSRASSEVSHREVAAFVAAPYVYTLRLETQAVDRLAEHRATFAAVARTVTRLPAPGQAFGFARPASAADLFGYLFD